MRRRGWGEACSVNNSRSNSRDENGYHHVVMSKRMKNYDDEDNHKK